MALEFIQCHANTWHIRHLNVASKNLTCCRERNNMFFLWTHLTKPSRWGVYNSSTTNCYRTNRLHRSRNIFMLASVHVTNRTLPTEKRLDKCNSKLCFSLRVCSPAKCRILKGSTETAALFLLEKSTCVLLSCLLRQLLLKITSSSMVLG